MKFLSLMFLMLTASLFSQSPDRIREEANTDYVYVEDNSEYARLWKQQVEARKTGDIATYNRVAQEITQKYPDKFKGGDLTNQNVLRVINHQQPPFVQDWIVGDLTVHGTPVGGVTTGNPSPFNRNIRLDCDSLGNQYAAFLTGANDTIVVYKSTTNGQTWARIFSILGSGISYIHSFDMHVTDSANGFRMGFAICLETDGGPGFNGDMYWLSVDQNGIPISVTPFAGVLGRGWISPAIVSDGFDWSAGSTYWYMTFQDVDTTTGAGTLALLAWSTNWGRTWALDTARSSFNDYELDIEYNFGADSIYVLLTNNLTTTDENLRLRWSALSNLGSSVAFKQFNPATTADHDRLGTVAVNRQTNEMAVMYTKFIGANQDVRLSHAPTGFGVAAAWTLDQTIGGLAGNESRAMIDCHQRQGAYRICYVSSGGSFDTVIYMSTFTLPNFAGRQVVNQTNITAVAPSVVGAGTGAAFNGGVLFATNNALMYDGSAVLTSVEPEGNNIPGAFSLEQNYPNPFNPSTVIKFSVPTNGYVSLKVYDIMGREVASIVNGELKAGVYNADFNASMLSSGVYFYKLTSGSFSETKKMMLIK